MQAQVPSHERSSHILPPSLGQLQCIVRVLMLLMLLGGRIRGLMQDREQDAVLLEKLGQLAFPYHKFRES